MQKKEKINLEKLKNIASKIINPKWEIIQNSKMITKCDPLDKECTPDVSCSPPPTCDPDKCSPDM